MQNSNRAVAQIYNGGGEPGNALSIWTEFRELLERTAGRVPSVRFDQTRLGDQRLYGGDIRKLHDHLDWAPKVGVEEGVRYLIKQWYVELVAAAAR